MNFVVYLNVDVEYVHALGPPPEGSGNEVKLLYLLYGNTHADGKNEGVTSHSIYCEPQSNPVRRERIVIGTVLVGRKGAVSYHMYLLLHSVGRCRSARRPRIHKFSPRRTDLT